MKQQIIATGLSGLVGSRIAELYSDEFEFIDFSLTTKIDITDFNLLKNSFLKYDEAKTVIHLAAFTDVDAAWQQNNDENGLCYKVNVLGTKNIARLCAQTKKYLIHISTDFVFDGKNPPAGGYTEEDKPNPIEWYGKTKYWAEKVVEEWSCNYLILRIAFPFKAKSATKNLEPQVKLDLVRKIIDKLKNVQALSMFNDQIITPTFADDIAMAIATCIRQRPKEIYHCTGSSWHSPYEIAAKIAKKFVLDENLIQKFSLKKFMQENPNSRPRQQSLPMSNKKIQKDLGVKMLTFDGALEKI